MRQSPEVVVALDGMDSTGAVHLVERLGARCTWVKVGLELYTREGPAVVAHLKDRGLHVFLDLKLHDIPNTVAGATRAAVDSGVDLLTLHAAGGRAMIRAARDVVDAADSALRLLAVTVLTSLDAGELAESWGAKGGLVVGTEVERLAELAIAAGAHGIVSSAGEVEGLRRALGDAALLVTPGIRMPSDTADDQARVARPADAVAAGADLLVVGRSITQASDPAAAMEQILADMAPSSAVS